MKPFCRYISTPLLVRTLTTGGEYVNLGATANQFQGYDWVSVQVWWDSLDVFDGVISLNERKDVTVPIWAEVPGQQIGLSSASGSHIFQDVDLFADECSLFINKGTATVGNIYYRVTARKQYGNDDIVSALNNLTRAIGGR